MRFRTEGEAMNRLVQALIKKHKGKVMTFRKLPAPAQLAVLHDMAVEGNHWSPAPDTDTLASQLPHYVEKYGKAKFGLVVVPTDELTQVVFEIARKTGEFRFKTFDGYHRSYLRRETVGDHGDSVWPVVLGDLSTEAIGDGMRRFHSYVRKGLKDIPGVYYVPDSWKKPTPKHCRRGLCIPTLGHGHCECPCQDCIDAGIHHG